MRPLSETDMPRSDPILRLLQSVLSSQFERHSPLQKLLCVDVSQGAQGDSATFEKVLDRRHGKLLAERSRSLFRPFPDALKAA
jgi:hypothetical protein